MQNSDKALPRLFLWQSLVTVLHTCVSMMLNVFEPAFIRNLFQNRYAEALISATRTMLPLYM